MRLWIFGLCLLCFGIPVFAQENQELLQRIEEVRANGGTALDLSNFYLESIPPEVFEISTLRSLKLGHYFSHNQFDSIPPEIGNLVNLVELRIENLGLRSIPPEIGNLTKLEFLDLSRNHLTSLPSTIGNLRSLKFLDLTHNDLGSLPPSIGNLSQLCYLALGHNHLRDLPDELGKLGQPDENRDCTNYTQHNIQLFVYHNPLDAIPDEVLMGGTRSILEYLRNEAWWYLQKLIVGAASFTGIMALGMLALLWKYRRGKQKRKRQEV